MSNWMWALGAGGVVAAIGAVLLGVAAFFVLRWVLLWYWRVDEHLALLREIRDALRAQPTAAGTGAAAPPVTALPEPAAAPKRAQPAGTDDPVAAVLTRLRRGAPAAG